MHSLTVAFTLAAWTNLTLYHINPLTYDPSSIANMDLGDLAGDLLFDITTLVNVFPCTSGEPIPPGVICDNGETAGHDIGVTGVGTTMFSLDGETFDTTNVDLCGWFLKMLKHAIAWCFLLLIIPDFGILCASIAVAHFAKVLDTLSMAVGPMEASPLMFR